MLSLSQRDMQRKYQNTGNDWNDSKYQQLGDIINECNSSIRKTLQELNSCLASLKLIEQSVAEYDSINLSGISSLNGSENGVSGLNEVSNSLSLRDHIQNETGWSKEIINSIKNIEQYEIYADAGLREEIINGRYCLIREIDMAYVDEKTGRTNRELMADGRAPYCSRTGERIELHHMGQSYDSPFAELCYYSEHDGTNGMILHDIRIESWRNDTRLNNRYNNTERPNHWIERSRGGVVA
jgi:hypothetical protein